MPASARLTASVLSLITCACLEPPELDELSAPLADLGGVDTWGPLDGTPIPSFPDDDTGMPGPAGTAGEADDGGTHVDPSLAQLRITEVLVDPPGKDGGADSPEFIELQNISAEPMILDGLKIDARSWPVLDASELGLVGFSLAPQARLVVQRWATDADPALATMRVVDAATFVGFLHSGGLRNVDGLIAVGGASEVVDELVYGAEPDPRPDAWVGAPVASPGGGRSLCRKDPSADHDDASDWSECAPSPGLVNDNDPDKAPVEPVPIPPGALQIVEVSANPPGPASDEKLHEFVEIINLSNVEVELSGCRIGDALAHDAPGVDPLEYLAGDGGCGSPTCLAPGARALLVGQGYLGPLGLGLVLATDDSTIADGGLTNTEPVVLWAPNNDMISSYRVWSDPAGEPLPADEQPLHRLDPIADDEPQNWISAPPTPGE
ncbi:hypothetical protein DB30_06470 [Enhygromyxa salina]|uniref:LTD domain-containing protein n=1 Tax=Enhygromyxa salina TaxID=215803 RepID=A0A0C1ZAJ8_9BACT|nr:lamin tail domain-containing protein [Enhygromyxa salina]KIG14659.1 hypothetical protein DB30_06470 [Enhygromyxa salina]